jgi:hypothetical protein
MATDDDQKKPDELIASRARLEAKLKALRAKGVPEEELGYYYHLLEALEALEALDPNEPDRRRN